MRNRILIVDDEADARMLAEDILSDLYEIECAEDAPSAREKIEAFSPEIVLTDIRMPGEDGIALLKSIKEKNPDIFVIMLTGHGDKEIAIEAMRNGAFDFLDKPFEDEEILSAVERAASLSNLQNQLEEVTQRTMESEKMASLGLMSGGIAHEINTPLGSIMLNSQSIERLLQKDEPDVKRAIKMANSIQNVVEHISKIINSLKAFSRDSSQDSFELSPIKKLVDDAMTICASNIKTHHVKVETDFSIPEDMKFNCRPSEVIQVMVNLINNACDAIKDSDEKWIKIEVSEQNDNLVLSISDSGTGLSKEDASKIFQPFYTTKAIDEGTGLGLYVCKGLVQSHGGTLELDTKRSNTSFSLTLPKKQEGEVKIAA